MTKQTKKHPRLTKWRLALKVGFFLAVRQIRGASKWTNFLVIIVMTLTFLNLVVVSGILVGLIEGAVRAVRGYYLGDIFISALDNHLFIERAPLIVSILQNEPVVSNYSPRYLIVGKIDENFQSLTKPKETKKIISTSFAGIDPDKENSVSQLRSKVIEGEYLEADDYDQVLVGSLLLRKYLDFESANFPVLEKTGVGKKIRIEINGVTRDVVVKGILRTKVDEVDRRIFFTERQLRSLANRYDYNVSEIAVRLRGPIDPITFKKELFNLGLNQYARIQTADDAEPKFIKDMKKTFALLGNVISSIGLVVAAITIFIVIFINAITRRKYIGILKGVGINSLAIETAYVFQALFYAAIGAGLGVMLVFLVIKPYFDIHPINFPFSDGVLVADASGTIWKILILIITTAVAGYVPAKLVTKQNTLDAILNR